MSLVSPPQSITPGTAAQVKPPANQIWGAVAIQNLSPYLLEVNAGAQVAWLAPFTSDLFSPGPTNTPIAVSAQNIVGGLTSTLGGAQIQATWYTQAEAADFAGAYPAALPGSAVIAATAPPGLVYGPTSSVIPISTNLAVQVSVPSTTRTLYIVISVAGGAGPNNVTVTGNQSGTIYRATAPPYLNSLFGSGDGSVCVVPVAGAVDTTYTVTGSAPVVESPMTITVYADSVSTPEHTFYNGTIRWAGSATNGAVILNGPCRLLTAFVQSNTASPAADITDTASGAPYAYAYAGTVTQLSFPDNTILDQGRSITVNGTTNNFQAWLTYAYP